jgi:hypothetical protein
MAGKIVADIIEASASLISLNVGNVTVFTASSVGSTLALVAGNVSFPSITSSGDTNTGLYFPAADTIGFVEGGVESMRIDSTGNMGIGTTSPTAGYKLDVAGGFKISGAIRENIFSVTGTTPALSPSNGTIQTWALSGISTPTAGTWSDGESLTIMINDGAAYTITWTSLPVSWIGGSAPTLATTGNTVIELWEVGGNIYGALVGQVT